MNNLIQTIYQIINLIKPSRTFSWQTAILISILIWIIAALFGLSGNLILQNFLSLLGCLLVIIGFSWFTIENPLIVHNFSISTWILIEFICLFAAILWSTNAHFIVMVWPVLSAIFAAWPEFVAIKRNPEILSSEKRIKLLIWILIHLVISCWINFSLIIQYWVSEYPSLLADDLNQSDFVVKIQPFSRSVTEGERVLNAMERQLKIQIDGKLWILADIWLNEPNQGEKLLTKAKQDILGIKEENWWKFNTEVAAQKTGYNLLMIAEWQGPSYNPQGYLLKKVCQVNPVNRQSTPANNNLRRVRKNNNSRVATIPQGKITTKPVKVANVQCQSVTKQIIEKNQVKSSPTL